MSGEPRSATDDLDDSILRAVASAPPRRAPAHPLSVLVVRALDGNSLDALVLAARTLAAPNGGEVGIVDGDLHVRFVDRDGLDPRAPALCALSLRDEFSQARLALVTALVGGGAPERKRVVEQAVVLVSTAAPNEILLDEATANRVDARFELRHVEPNWILLGDRSLAGSSTPPPAPAAGDVDVSAFAVVHAGLRFARPETEAAYRLWQREEAIPFTRIGMIASIINWLGSLVATRFTSPEVFALNATLTLLIMMPLLIAILAMTYSRRLLPWMLPGTMIANSAAGCLVVVVCWNMGLPDVAMGGIVIVASFGFTIFRLRTAQAALAVVPYVLLYQAALLRGFPSVHLGTGAVVWYSFVTWAAFVSGLLTCMVLDRVSRDRFRQDRVIAAQRAIIEGERERANRLEREGADREVKLLNAEVRRQVAERSRDLSEALARLSDAPRAPVELSPGDVVENRYRIVRAVGAGGMGQVFEVERTADRRRLALKVLTGVANRAALARFAREAQVAAELDHPNVVSTIDVGVTQTGTLFLVMDLVTGSSLEREGAHYGDARWALPILQQIAEALVAMHERGIVHRDLKPANVLVDAGRVKVADFGIASLTAEPLAAPTPDGATVLARANAALTRTGAVMGTPSYMAPELHTGAQAALAASDVFSLGVVAYEILASRLPHAIPPVFERLSGKTPSPPPSLGSLRPDLPSELTELVDRCLADAPAARPSARAFADALPREFFPI